MRYGASVYDADNGPSGLKLDHWSQIGARSLEILPSKYRALAVSNDRENSSAKCVEIHRLVRIAKDARFAIAAGATIYEY